VSTVHPRICVCDSSLFTLYLVSAQDTTQPMREIKYLRGETGTVVCTKVRLYTDASLAWTADSSRERMCTGGPPETWNKMLWRRERKKGQANASGQGKTLPMLHQK
jgi:hypothetical protein